MPAHAFDDLQRAIKSGTLESVYYFHGPEEVLKAELVQQLLERAIDPSLRDFNYDHRSAVGLDPESLHALLNTLPMMSERRMVVLSEVDQIRRKAKVRAVLDRYLQQPSDQTVLVLVQSGGDGKPDAELVRGAWAVEFSPLPPGRALRWLALQATARSVEFGPGAAEHLLEVAGCDLAALTSELDKLSALGRTGPLTLEEVGRLLGVRHGETLQDWRDALFEGRTGQAAAMVGPLLQQSGMSGVKMVSTIGTVLIGLGLARALYDRGTRQRALQQALFDSLRRVRPFGLPPWGPETVRWSKWAERWPLERVARALEDTLQADRMLKTTRISDDQGVLTDLVFRLGTRAREAA